MELIIALILFAAIVASWLFLPAAPGEEIGLGASVLPATQAQRTA